MKLEIDHRVLCIRLSTWEKLLTVRKNDIEIPISEIQTVELVPKLDWRGWRQIRWPGTYIPGIIKAGSYWTPSGWEFWYVRKNQPCLIITGKLGKFRKVILGIPQVSSWHKQLLKIIR